MTMTRRPVREGLYDSTQEHDACGVGFIAHLKNQKSHKIIEDGLEILVRLTHRGAAGADPREGDGAGILFQLDDGFFRTVAEEQGIALPEPGRYAVAQVFFPQNDDYRETCRRIFAQTVAEEGLKLLGWRRVPTDRVRADLPPAVVAREPVIEQAFIAAGDEIPDQAAFERKLFVARKVIGHRVRALGRDDPAAFYICSMSSRTIVYKGMFLAYQLPAYYADLRDARLESAFAIVHQRFSTNTLPAWELAHPFRMVAHNGEINTLRGNINWMNARRHAMKSELLGKDLEKIWPVIVEGQSDTACFDNALELLVMGGYELAHAAMLMIPEAWSGNPLMDEDRRAFYEYHAALMEPWDGPAAVVFTDGVRIGATLDRNGLRPARYLVTKDDIVIGASEAGVLDVPEDKIVKKWRLQPGKMFLVDLEQGRIIDDDELKRELARRRPYKAWLKETQYKLEELPEEIAPQTPEHEDIVRRQRMFGYTMEDLKLII
ncbi:MAG: glutamate synthase subunit alpha, partial [Zetaproteobacteria bacterium]